MAAIDYKDNDAVIGEFVCYNDSCKLFEVYVTQKMKYSEQYLDWVCDECGQDVVFKGIQTEPGQEIKMTYNSFGTLSKEDKHKVLKKRSHNDFLKNIKEKKDYLDRL